MARQAPLSEGARYDAVVIGAGFGGLGAALTLAESGAKVLLCEALTYPGGCASTFQRQGWRFEAGATLFSGFGEGQLMRRWIDRHHLAVDVRILDPMVELRTPAWRLAIPPDREALVARLAAFPGAPRDRLAAFFAEQHRVADALWALFDDPALLPPFDLASLTTHALRVPRYLPLLRLVARPLSAMVERHGLSGFEPLRVYLDALCQITVQCPAGEAEAPFALAATDYCFRGTGHVHGGIGVLAGALADAVTGSGGEVRYASRVSAIHSEPGGWRVTVRGVDVRTPRVFANLLPQGIGGLGVEDARMCALGARVEEGWSACMLYLGLKPGADLRASAHHLELVDDPALPLVEGNHLFCSVSGADEPERGPGRTVTVSTHVPVSAYAGLDAAGKAAYAEGIQRHMGDVLSRLAPEIAEAVDVRMPASPRTWERFTRRAHGCVGGIPRRVGWQNYRDMGPAEVAPGLWMIGDTAFPGQSTLATAIGGVRAAQVALR